MAGYMNKHNGKVAWIRGCTHLSSKL